MSSKTTTQVDPEWLESFFAFNVFAGEHGALPRAKSEAIIPGTSLTEMDLVNWIRTQNRCCSRLTPEQMSALNNASFPWILGDNYQREFNKRELVKFQNEHGHCNVPQHSGALGSWVKGLRSLYKNHQAGVETTLTSEFIDELEAIGFVWNLKGNWLEKFDLLTTYAEEHGNCDVARQHESLGRWVQEQRSEYKKKAADKKSAMTEEKIDMLNSIGFKWSINKKLSKVCA